MNIYQKIGTISGVFASLASAGLAQNAYETKIHNADKIVIDEVQWCIGKEYEIFVDDELVATVEGKDFNWWEDKFVLRTVDGKALMTEQEHKKFLKFDRAASFYDSYGNNKGYMAEKFWKDVLKLDHIFYLYDSEMKPIGKAVNEALTYLEQIEIYNENGRKDYSITEKYSVFDDVYTVHVWNKNSEVPVEQVILIGCIEDAIADAKSSDDD